MSEPKPALFDTVCFVGIGLIGSSLARAMRKHGLARRLVALDPSEKARRAAVELGVVDAATGRAFREEILSKGNSAPADQLYRNFMGRDPLLEPLLVRSGLA